MYFMDTKNTRLQKSSMFNVVDIVVRPFLKKVLFFLKQSIQFVALLWSVNFVTRH